MLLLTFTRQISLFFIKVLTNKMRPLRIKERHAMTKPGTDFSVRSKIWVEDDNGNVVFGLGRYRMLEAVGRLGSLQAAAKELKMSYRALWLRVRASEDRMGRTLVERKGKGSCLTPFAENLMKQYRRMLAVVHQESDEVYDSLMADRLSE